MICFLTSLPVDESTGKLNTANRFASELRRCLPRRSRALFICSDPDADNRYYAGEMKSALEEAGFLFSRFDLLDGKNEEEAPALVRSADLIILAGGHVPTQNRFFARIALSELLKDFGGVIVGISAGSMNCAETVYAQPELPREATNPAYRRFLPGLGLTKTALLPHYYGIRNETLDGLRILEEITLPDSVGRTFWFIPDGSYLYIENGREELRGEAYLVKDGTIARVSSENDVTPVVRGEAPAGFCGGRLGASVHAVKNQ